MQVSNAVTRSECHICPGTWTALADNEQVGMRAPASEQGRRGACMATPEDRMLTATVLGARSSSQQRGRGAYAYGPNAGSSRKREISRHAAQQKSHTNEMRSGSRDPGVKRPGDGLGQSPARSKFSRARSLVQVSFFHSQAFLVFLGVEKTQCFRWQEYAPISYTFAYI